MDKRIGFGLSQSCENRWSLCVDDKSRNLYIVVGGYLRILGAPSVQSCCTISIYASYGVFVYGRYRKSRLGCVLYLTWICLDGIRLYEEQRQTSSGSTRPACLKKR